MSKYRRYHCLDSRPPTTARQAQRRRRRRLATYLDLNFTAAFSRPAADAGGKYRRGGRLALPTTRHCTATRAARGTARLDPRSLPSSPRSTAPPAPAVTLSDALRFHRPRLPLLPPPCTLSDPPWR